MVSKIDDFLDQYYAFWVNIDKLYDRFARENGVNPYGLYIFIELNKNKNKNGCTQTNISESYGIPKQTINTILQGYLKDGLVAFEISDADKRNKTVSLTPKGKEYADSIVGKLTALEHSVLMKMGEDKVKGMLEGNSMFLELFRASLDKMREEKEN